MNDELVKRLDLLDEIAQLGAPGRLPADVQQRAATVSQQARARLGHGTTNTVVALAGGTGSGKSSLFNALIGAPIAASSVRRPTTSVAQAIVVGEPADGLLDWLQIDRRHSTVNPELDGLVLVDLPDHDSTVTAHRAEVDRLVEVVDVFCWVVDPQKYADAALHRDYLARFSGHAGVTVVVLNQADLLSPTDRAACLTDLGQLLARNGFSGVRIVATSAQTGEGVGELRREIGARVAERRAVVARLAADLDWLGTDLLAAASDATLQPVSQPQRSRIIDAATTAAGGNEVATGVEAAMKHRASLAMGWPPVRWVRNLRPDPLKRLGLGTAQPKRKAKPSTGVTVRRTALVTNPVGQAILANEVRAAARTIGDLAAPTARERLDLVAASTLGGLPDALDAALGSTELPIKPPRWWTLAGLAQSLVSLAMIGGFVWLGAIAVLDWLRVPALPLPTFRGWPVPTLLVFGGAVLGIAIAMLGRRIVAAAARRRGRLARDALRRQLSVTIDDLVINPLNTEAGELNRLGDLVRRFG